MEWEVLAADMPASAWARWRRVCPALRGVDRVVELPGWLLDQSHDVRDAVVLGLVRLVQEGSQLAGRTVLRLLGPGLSRMVGDLRGRAWSLGCSPGEVGEHLVAAFWEAMWTYPIQARPRRVAANLILDARTACLWGNRSRFAAEGLLRSSLEMPRDPVEIDHDEAAAERSLSGRGGDSGEEVLLAHQDDPAVLLEELLTWAVTQEVITTRDAKLLRDLCSPEKPGNCVLAYAAAARAQGINEPAARQRACRAMNKLRSAAAAQGMTSMDPTHWPARRRVTAGHDESRKLVASDVSQEAGLDRIHKVSTPVSSGKEPVSCPVVVAS
jgi:hypothetical protein